MIGQQQAVSFFRAASFASAARRPQNFGEHGRELISSEIALRLLRLLCDEAGRRPLLDKYGVPAELLAQLLQRAVFKVRAAAAHM